MRGHPMFREGTNSVGRRALLVRALQGAVHASRRIRRMQRTPTTRTHERQERAHLTAGPHVTEDMAYGKCLHRG